MGTVGQIRQAESTPSRSDTEFRRLLEMLPAGAYTCDADGLITYYNQYAVRVWGREPRLNDPVDRFCGSFKLFSAGGAPLTHDQCWMALALRDAAGYNGHEIVVERPDGTRLTVLAHANPLHDDAGTLLGAVNVLVDITDRKRAEDAVREADRRKTDFLALLAHELRNPLAPIRNGLEIIKLGDADRPAVEQARAMMERQLGHLVRLIDDLLDLSRITKGKIDLRRDRIDLAGPVQDAVEACRSLVEERGHHLAVTFPPRPVYVDGDRTRLAQVFANLLNNSARYTPRGGHIKLAVERQGSDVVVTVGDDGAGVPADVLPRVFDMFTQADRSLERSEGGLGIGLALVKGLVELHGGTVSARSDGPGRGSEFGVRLPVLLARGRGSQPGDGGGDAARPGSVQRILVVDDNQDAAVSLALMLKILGHDSRTAYDGLEAVEAAGAFRPDVVLLDIGLPKLNGYEACRQIRAQPWGERMVLIALTGWGQDEDRSRSKEAGFNFHMVKPVDPATLQKLLAGLLLTPA
ncbi:MAG: luxQ 2 [Gemmataceae bacterium]|nr:luxQ 2 [Gemmataceae bacterium]